MLQLHSQARSSLLMGELRGVAKRRMVRKMGSVVLLALCLLIGERCLNKDTSRPSHGSMLGQGIQTWAGALSMSGQKKSVPETDMGTQRPAWSWRDL